MYVLIRFLDKGIIKGFGPEAIYSMFVLNDEKFERTNEIIKQFEEMEGMQKLEMFKNKLYELMESFNLMKQKIYISNAKENENLVIKYTQNLKDIEKIKERFESY